MKRIGVPVCSVSAVLLLVLGASPPTRAQLVVQGGDEPSLFTSDTPDLPHRPDIGSARDVFISDDLEIGGRLFVDRLIHVNRDPEDIDQFIYFSDDGSTSDESFSWDDSADAFSLTNDLDLLDGAGGAATIRARAENELQLLSEAPEMYFLIDSNSNDNAALVDHTFTWANNSFAANQRAMVLRSVTGDVGDLEIDGSLTQNIGFDIAESFLAGEPARPGQLVAVDPTRPNAVVLATDADAGRVLGVVSTRPAIIMGGGALSVAGLRRTWGAEATDLFLSRRAELEVEVLGANEALRQQASILASMSTYEGVARARFATSAFREQPLADEDSDRTQAPKELSENELRAGYDEAFRNFQTRMLDAVMSRFFERYFASVALAGRVPVEVDADLGSIRPGDLLAVSPTSGVARRADSAGAIVGTALEGLDRGQGRILMLVHRGWIGPARSSQIELADLRAENARLVARLARIEETLGAIVAKPTQMAGGIASE